MKQIIMPAAAAAIAVAVLLIGTFPMDSHRPILQDHIRDSAAFLKNIPMDSTELYFYEIGRDAGISVTVRAANRDEDLDGAELIHRADSLAHFRTASK